MSKELQGFTLSLAHCEADLRDFQFLLESKSELSESLDVLPFFREHSHLAGLTASLSVSVDLIDCQATEFDLFGNFRCDWVVGSKQGRSYSLVEFEDARPNSIFNRTGRYHDEWGRRFEHGFSQLVDWFWALDEYRGNPDLERRFGKAPEFVGVLVVGRREFLEEHHVARLHWRLQKVVIDSHRIACITFDDLYDRLAKRLAFLRQIADEGST
jgi:hypothetical protein